MAKCKQCGKEYEAKRSTSVYCGPKCKQEFYRNRMNPVVTVSPELVTLSKPHRVTVTDLELCQYCSTSLPALQKPRQHPGACYPCAIRQPRKTVDHTYTLKHTDKMTVMERLFYRPGQRNFVSVPGRACHGVC